MIVALPGLFSYLLWNRRQSELKVNSQMHNCLLGSKKQVHLGLFVRLFNLRWFGFVYFLFILVSGKGCGL